MELEPVTEFERELTKAMQRVEAPAGFAEDVMARAERPEHAKIERPERAKIPKAVATTPSWWAWRTWAVGAAAAAIVLGSLAGERMHDQHVRQAQAQQQFEAAQRITDQTLAHVRAQVQQAISLSE
jgi:hypothetical protein